MNVIDGTDLTTSHDDDFDVVVVGSGPAGAAAARTLARSGARVAVVEEGPWVEPGDFPADGFSAMSKLYRDMGASVMMGRPPMPVLQGRVVGGTSVVNGAISWRLPKDVYDEWVRADPALDDALGWHRIEEALDEVESDLSIGPTDPTISGANNALLAKGADALQLAHRPIRRNVARCRGLGRCLQGCPQGRKMSMDQSYLPEACDQGAVIFSSTRVEQVEVRSQRATGVVAHAAGGGRVRLGAHTAVVMAASAIQTPALLIRSGINHGPVGDHLQCHPGVSVAGRFGEPVRIWCGATQGHEVIGLRSEGLKFEALGYDLPIAAMRLKSIGERFRDELSTLDRWCQWGAALRAEGAGRVRPAGTRTRVRFALTDGDMVKLRRAVQVLGEMLLAAGAEVVTPGVFGWHERVRDADTMASFGKGGPLDPRAYTLAATHLFGTCRMGSDPRRSVVGPDFGHHRIRGLYVADSSVFPSNIGVNPQSSIIAFARLCGERVLAAS